MFRRVVDNTELHGIRFEPVKVYACSDIKNAPQYYCDERGIPLVRIEDGQPNKFDPGTKNIQYIPNSAGDCTWVEPSTVSIEGLFINKLSYLVANENLDALHKCHADIQEIENKIPKMPGERLDRDKFLYDSRYDLSKINNAQDVANINHGTTIVSRNKTLVIPSSNNEHKIGVGPIRSRSWGKHVTTGIYFDTQEFVINTEGLRKDYLYASDGIYVPLDKVKLIAVENNEKDETALQCFVEEFSVKKEFLKPVESNDEPFYKRLLYPDGLSSEILNDFMLLIRYNTIQEHITGQAELIYCYLHNKYNDSADILNIKSFKITKKELLDFSKAIACLAKSGTTLLTCSKKNFNIIKEFYNKYLHNSNFTKYLRCTEGIAKKTELHLTKFNIETIEAKRNTAESRITNEDLKIEINIAQHNEKIVVNNNRFKTPGYVTSAEQGKYTFYADEKIYKEQFQQDYNQYVKFNQNGILSDLKRPEEYTLNLLSVLKNSRDANQVDDISLENIMEAYHKALAFLTQKNYDAIYTPIKCNGKIAGILYLEPLNGAIGGDQTVVPTQYRILIYTIKKDSKSEVSQLPFFKRPENYDSDVTCYNGFNKVFFHDDAVSKENGEFVKTDTINKDIDRYIAEHTGKDENINFDKNFTIALQRARTNGGGTCTEIAEIQNNWFIKFQDRNNEIKYTTLPSLNLQQLNMVKAILSHQNGVIDSAVGSGKTHLIGNLPGILEIAQAKLAPKDRKNVFVIAANATLAGVIKKETYANQYSGKNVFVPTADSFKLIDVDFIQNSSSIIAQRKKDENKTIKDITESFITKIKNHIQDNGIVPFPYEKTNNLKRPENGKDIENWQQIKDAVNIYKRLCSSEALFLASSLDDIREKLTSVDALTLLEGYKAQLESIKSRGEHITNMEIFKTKETYICHGIKENQKYLENESLLFSTIPGHSTGKISFYPHDKNKINDFLTLARQNFVLLIRSYFHKTSSACFNSKIDPMDINTPLDNIKAAIIREDFSYISLDEVRSIYKRLLRVMSMFDENCAKEFYTEKVDENLLIKSSEEVKQILFEKIINLSKRLFANDGPYEQLASGKTLPRFGEKSDTRNSKDFAIFSSLLGPLLPGIPQAGSLFEAASGQKLDRFGKFYTTMMVENIEKQQALINDLMKEVDLQIEQTKTKQSEQTESEHNRATLYSLFNLDTHISDYIIWTPDSLIAYIKQIDTIALSKEQKKALFKRLFASKFLADEIHKEEYKFLWKEDNGNYQAIQQIISQYGFTLPEAIRDNLYGFSGTINNKNIRVLFGNKNNTDKYTLNQEKVIYENNVHARILSKETKQKIEHKNYKTLDTDQILADHQNGQIIIFSKDLTEANNIQIKQKYDAQLNACYKAHITKAVLEVLFSYVKSSYGSAQGAHDFWESVNNMNQEELECCDKMLTQSVKTIDARYKNNKIAELVESERLSANGKKNVETILNNLIKQNVESILQYLKHYKMADVQYNPICYGNDPKDVKRFKCGEGLILSSTFAEHGTGLSVVNVGGIILNNPEVGQLSDSIRNGKKYTKNKIINATLQACGRGLRAKNPDIIYYNITHNRNDILLSSDVICSDVLFSEANNNEKVADEASKTRCQQRISVILTKQEITNNIKPTIHTPPPPIAPKVPEQQSNTTFTDDDLKNIFKYFQGDDHDKPGKDSDNPNAAANFKPFIYKTTQPQLYEGVFKMSLQDNNILILVENQISFNANGRDCTKDRENAINALYEKLKSKGFNPEIVGNGTNIKIKLDDFSKNNFFKGEPLSKVYKFINSLENDDNLNKFAKNVSDILSNIEAHLKDYDNVGNVQILRGNNDKNKTIKALEFCKYDGYESNRLDQTIQRYKRVPIPNSPFWVSIHVVTGECVIRINENEMYYKDLPIPLIQALKEKLSKITFFKNILNDEKANFKNPEDYYYVANGIYFCQKPLLELKITQTLQDIYKEENKDITKGQDKADYDKELKTLMENKTLAQLVQEATNQQQALDKIKKDKTDPLDKQHKIQINKLHEMRIYNKYYTLEPSLVINDKKNSIKSTDSIEKDNIIYTTRLTADGLKKLVEIEKLDNKIEVLELEDSQNKEYFVDQSFVKNSAEKLKEYIWPKNGEYKSIIVTQSTNKTDDPNQKGKVLQHAEAYILFTDLKGKKYIYSFNNDIKIEDIINKKIAITDPFSSKVVEFETDVSSCATFAFKLLKHYVKEDFNSLQNKENVEAFITPIPDALKYFQRSKETIKRIGDSYRNGKILQNGKEDFTTNIARYTQKVNLLKNADNGLLQRSDAFYSGSNEDIGILTPETNTRTQITGLRLASKINSSISGDNNDIKNKALCEKNILQSLGLLKYVEIFYKKINKELTDRLDKIKVNLTEDELNNYKKDLTDLLEIKDINLLQIEVEKLKNKLTLLEKKTIQKKALATQINNQAIAVYNKYKKNIELPWNDQAVLICAQDGAYLVPNGDKNKPLQQNRKFGQVNFNNGIDGNLQASRDALDYITKELNKPIIEPPHQPLPPVDQEQQLKAERDKIRQILQDIYIEQEKDQSTLEQEFQAIIKDKNIDALKREVIKKQQALDKIKKDKANALALNVNQSQSRDNDNRSPLNQSNSNTNNGSPQHYQSYIKPVNTTAITPIHIQAKNNYESGNSTWDKMNDFVKFICIIIPPLWLALIILWFTGGFKKKTANRTTDKNDLTREPAISKQSTSGIVSQQSHNTARAYQNQESKMFLSLQSIRNSELAHNTRG